MLQLRCPTSTICCLAALSARERERERDDDDDVFYAGNTTRSTVQYSAAAPPRALGGGAPTFGTAHSTKETSQAAQQSGGRLGFSKTGRAVVGIAGTQ